MIKKNLKHIFILLLLSYGFFMFGNNIVSLTNPDEVFYAQTAKEMIQHNSWMTPYLFDAPQFEKPIFLYWLLRISFAIFGITNFSARFFPALFAGIGIIAVYLLCLLGFKNEKKAFISSLILMSSGVYIGLARTVFTDMIFSIFILLSLLSFFWAYMRQERKGLGLLLFFGFCALAVLSKGPLGIIIPFLTIIAFLSLREDLKFICSKFSLWGLLVFILVSFPWYIFMIRTYGNTFIDEFFYNDHIRRIFEAEHAMNDTWYFYPLSMVWGMLPWSLYVVIALFYLFKNFKRRQEPIYTLLACWILVVFFVFQPAHSKLVSYIFPFFPALAIVAGSFFYDALASGKRQRPLFYASLLTAIFLVLMILVLVIGSILFSTYISTYLSSKLPIYLLVLLLSVLAILFFILLIQGKFLKSAYAVALFIPAIFCIVPLIDSDIEPFVSPRDSCKYLLDNYKIDNAILCSKFFARGVRYYSDKEVAVLNPYGKNYFSPHPIPFLDSDEKVEDFLRKQGTTYCVLKKSSVEDIERMKSRGFKYKILKVIGNEYILKIEH